MKQGHHYPNYRLKRRPVTTLTKTIQEYSVATTIDTNNIAVLWLLHQTLIRVLIVVR
jgi:hypothetical protein